MCPLWKVSSLRSLWKVLSELLPGLFLQSDLARSLKTHNLSFKFQVVKCYPHIFHSSVQLLSRVLLFVTPWSAAHQASLSITNSQSLLKLMSIESVMPSSHLILCHPLFLPLSTFPSSGSFPISQFLAKVSSRYSPALTLPQGHCCMRHWEAIISHMVL